MTGVPSGTTGLWTSLTLTMKDHSQMTFTPADPGAANVKYVLTRITNLVGHYVAINRDTAANGSRILSVQNDLATPATLLQFGYTGTQLTSVQDVASAVAADHRQITYTYGSYGLLSSVSQIAAVGATGVPDRWRYSYQLVGLLHYLAAVDVPNPANFAQYSRAKLLYDANGFVATSSDAAGRLHAYTSGAGAMRVDAYNVNGSPAMNFIRNFGSFGLPGAMATNVDTGFRDGNIHTETVGYTDTNNPWMPTSRIDRLGHRTDITYNDAFGNPATVKTPRGVVVTNTYDFNNFPLGQVATTQETHVTGGTTDATKQATTYTYYAAADGALNGLVKTVTSPAPDSTVGNIGSPNQTTITYTLPSATSAGGQVLTVAAPGNNAGGTLTTTYNYTSDPSYDANGAPGSYSQNEQPGEPLTVTNPAGNVTHYRYDGRGNLVLSIDAIGNKTNYVYNVADQMTQAIAPATNTGTPTARALTQTNYGYPGGPATSEQVYDESGALVREVDTTYTPDGEVASVTGSTEPASYTYDALSRVSTLTDGNGHVTNYSYDAVGNVSLIQYPGASGVFDTLTYTYDADQNLLTKKDGRGITTTYARNVDPESMVTSITYANLPAGVTPIGTTGYTYDVYGRLSQMSDYTGTTAYSNYDDLDEPLLMTRSFTGGPQNQQIAYAHYPDGSRRQMQTPLTTGVNSNLFGYQYDVAGRLTQAQFPWNQGTWTHTYEANGWLQATAGPKALGSSHPLAATNYGYNPRGFLTLLNNNTAYYDPEPTQGDTLQAGPGYSQMTYDALGNRLGEKATLPVMAAFQDTGTQDSFGNEIYNYQTLLYDATHTRTYGYDTANAATANRDVMLSETSVLSGGNSGLVSRYKNVWSHGFGYDSAYNPTRFDYFDRSSGMDQTYSGLGFTSDNQHSTGDFGSTFSFDGNGNPTTYKNAGFSFDPEDRLTAIASPAFAATYDGNGLRATKTASGVTTYFIYDGGTPVVEESWNGSTATVTAANGYAADGWRARYEPSTSTAYDYLYDPQGNLVQRQTKTAYSQALGAYDQTVYEAYGALRSDVRATFGTTGGAVTTPRDPVGFGGQYGYYTDKETGLLCLTHRYYDPGTGRFINRDPIGYKGGVNLYGFAGGNPVNFADPLGLKTVTLFGTDFDFTAEGVGEGLDTSGHALLSSLSFGVYDGGKYKNEPGFEVSRNAWTVATIVTPEAASGIGVRVAEGVIGHVAERHLYKSVGYLIARTVGKKALKQASSYYSATVANYIIRRTLSKEATEIATWLAKGAKDNLPLHYAGKAVIGYGVKKGSTALIALKEAIVVLRSDGAGGYKVLTSYPK